MKNDSTRKQSIPIVYSCSGASSAAQLTNHLAIRLDRSGLAEMSCIAGVGGDVKALLRTARSGRQLIVLDGCPLRCARACLARHGLEPDLHFDLSQLGVRKRYGVDFEPSVVDPILSEIRAGVSALSPPNGPPQE